MLTELKVSQFAIIDHIHIQFNSGLNILSGETGAGKSILIKSLALLMGAKSSHQDIRSHRERASIEGAFDLSKRPDILDKLENMGIHSEEKELIVRRIIEKNGKSKVYLNGSLSTVTDLRRIVSPLVTMSNPREAPLVEITGQHENKDLISLSYQLDMLDQFCGNFELRAEFKKQYDQAQKLQARIQNLEERSQIREQQLDFLNFQIQEIETLALEEDEDLSLALQIKELKMKGQWDEWLGCSLESLNLGENSILSKVSKMVSSAPDHPSLGGIGKQLSEATILLEDVAFSLQQIQSRQSESEVSLDRLEDRLSRIRKLQKKFGHTVAEILTHLEEMKKEHSELYHLSTTLENLQEEKRKILQGQIQEALKLREKRRTGAQLLAQEVNEELRDLNMKGLEFLISLEELEKPTPTGMDRLLFQTKTGPGEIPRDLGKAASGGELSRLLLSLKQVIGINQYPCTFLFDEVDTGVSGPTAEKVGSKLQHLAQHQQVICVTHLPQVASFGDHHFFIEKKSSPDSVEMEVKRLNQKQRVDEIARLISGEKRTKTSIAHARKLLEL